MPMSSIPSFAIAGCGRIAVRHAEEIRKYGQLLGVCDPDPERCKKFSEEQNCREYSSLQALLAGDARPDILVICTPNGLHASHCLQALESGCHVLCEKPFALHGEDCQRVIRAAELAGLHLFIVHSYRYNAVVSLVREAVLEGWLGNVTGFQMSCLWSRDDSYYQSSWKGSRDLDGGILFTQFSHFIDLLSWFFGEADTVIGITKNVQHRQSIDFEDMGAALLEFKGGVSGSLYYTINSFKKNMEGSLTLFGDKGTVRIGGQYCNQLLYQQTEGAPLSLPEQPVNPLFHASNHHLIYLDFMDKLSSNKPDYRNARDALKTVELIEQIYRASGR